jgi:hypothetical protein
MPIKLNGSTSGSVTVQAPAVAGTNTLTLPAATGNLLSDQSIVPGSSSVPTNGMYLPATNALGFATNSTNAMYIDASGNLLVGATSGSQHILQKNFSGGFATIVYASASSNPFGVLISYPNNTPNGSSNQFLLMQDSTAYRAYFNSNGGLSNYQANNSNLSDERKKTDIQLSGAYLDKICAIPVKTFLYKDQTDTDRNLGVIAQDVEKVAPELVDKDGWLDTPPKGEDPYKSIYQTDLQYALMKCIQELSAKNDALEARLVALEAK